MEVQKLVNPTWLAQHLDDPKVVILDASYKAVNGAKPMQEGTQIRGARRFDIDYFSDKQSDLPHMLPPAGEFEQKARALGINQDSHLVVYDDLGIYSSPRVWWMFKSMGHKKVSVLDGGLPKWVADGYPVEETKSGDFTAGVFSAFFDRSRVR